MRVPLLLLLSVLVGHSAGQVATPKLVIAGGGVRSPVILDRFIELAGAPDALIVVIPTASTADSFGAEFGGLRALNGRGATNVALLHTRDRDVANADSFVQVIDRAAGVWFTGGRQWRLADAYLGTRTEEALKALLARGGVVGGSSAGATIQGSYLARGDTRTNTIMMGDHTEGFGFIADTAIDQHLLRRNRHFDLIAIVETFPHLLGIGIDEDTALVVEGDWAEVIGSSLVAIYDYERSIDSGGHFYFLGPGDRFRISTRTPYRGDDLLERVVARPWPP